MKNKKNIIHTLGALLMTMCMIISLMPVTFLANKSVREIPEDAIFISSPEDLLKLAENCKVNTWSVDKTIVLNSDIDVSEYDFTGIPTFGGIFVGNGFTIKGFELNDDGSVVGFFRYLQKTAIVEYVNFEGTVLPEGSQSIVGAIAGKNAGKIQNCTFKGTVAGNEQIGGLVGVNETTGVVEHCKVSGMVYGNHFVGGIAGENHGVIRDVTNNAEINTLSVQNSVALEDITLDSLLNTENASTTTDIGGITGFNSGVVRSCKNNGLVGYQRMGYNIGGIAGRQSGYIVNCVNNADIQGRKEIGGIAGHVEPNIAVNFSEDGLEQLQEQLQVVEGSVNNLKNNIQNESSELQQQMGKVEEELGKVKKATDALIEAVDVEGTEKNLADAKEILEDIVLHLNKLLSLIENLAKSLEDVDPQVKVEIETLIEQLKVSINNISKALESLDEDALNTIVTELNTLMNAVNTLIDKLMPEDTESGTDDPNSPFKKFSEKVTELQQELDKLEKMLESLNFEEATKTIQSISTRITNLVKIVEKMSALLEGVDTDTYAELNALLTQMQTALDNISKYLENPTAESLGKIAEELSSLSSALSEVAKKLSELTADADKLGKEWSTLITEFNNELKGLQEDLDKLEKIMDGMDLAEASKILTNITSILNDLLKLADEISKSMELDPATQAEINALVAQIQTSINKINTAINNLDLSSLTTIVSELNTLMKTMSALVTALEKAYDEVEEVTSEWEKILKEMESEMKALQSDMDKLQKLLDSLETDLPEAAMNDVGDSMNDLFTSLGNMGNLMDSSMQNLGTALDDVMNQLDQVIRITENFDETIQAAVEDVSDLDTVENTIGKIADSKNYGRISGDYNIGGIVGLMGEESDFSTAEQAAISGTASLNIAYQMRAVVRSCRNVGTIFASKQNAGGIVGQMMLGCVLESINLGNIDAIQADYVGGVAGKSNTIIRNSSSKAVIAGNRYVGGIAGEAKEMTNCYSFVQIAAATENVGAIAGGVKELPSETNESLLGNVFFVAGDNYGGIDGITYAGATNSMDLTAFLQIEDLDESFKTVNVRFESEGKDDVVKTIAVGESLSLEQVPEFDVEDGEEVDWQMVPAVASKVLGMGEIADVEYISEAALSNILFDQTYQVVFGSKGSVISAADRTENNRSILLAVGSFAKNTILEMQDVLSSEAKVNGKTAIINYLVNISNVGVKKLHFLLPEGVEAGAVKLFVKDASGIWVERTFIEEGSYIVFDFNSDDSGFALVKDASEMTGKLLAIAAVLLLIGIMLSVLRKVRKKKNL
ncbi:MAG: hypothetical protein IJO60_04830 [Agathobacter sp.]|nr:hypothetical protein [Agathobacter sp.]